MTTGSPLSTGLTAGQLKIAQPVAFIDDVLRHAYWPAKQFFYDLLKVPFTRLLADAPRPSVRELMWADGLLESPAAPATSKGEEQEWIAHYNEAGDDLREALDRYVDPACLYISYEASPGLRAYLDARGITYIDLRISPLRFMPDVVIAMRSNSETINAVLADVAMTRADIEAEALLLMASARHLERYRKPAQAQEGLAPLHYVGQTPNDASIVIGESYFRLEDVIPDLTAELSQRDVVYLRHPWADEAHVQREIAALKAVSKSLRVSDENSYDLLCSEQPGEFFGISSGLLQEAPLFGKPALSMLPPVCPLAFPDDEQEAEGGYYQVSFDTFIDARFWNGLLTGTPVGWRDNPRTMRPNQLRELHNVWWGYPAHKVKASDYTRALTGEMKKEVETLRKTTQFLMSFLSQAPQLASSLAHHLIAQRWRWPDGAVVSFGDDGSVTKDGVRLATWRALTGRPDAAMILWNDGGWMDLAELDPAGTRLRCRNNAGDSFSVVAM